MDKGIWQATLHGVAQSQTQLSLLSGTLYGPFIRHKSHLLGPYLYVQSFLKGPKYHHIEC